MPDHTAALVNMLHFREWMSRTGLSKNTLLSYNFRIQAYGAFNCSRQLEPNLLSPELVENYLTHLQANGARPAAFNQTLHALQKFCQFACIDFPDIGRIDCDPLRKCMPTREVEILYATLCVEERSLKARALAILCFFVDLTPSGCIKLNLADIEVHGLTCNVRTGQRDEDVVWLHGQAASIMSRWLAVSRSARLEGPLFCNEQGERISRRGVDYLIKSLGFGSNLLLSARLLNNSGRKYLAESCIKPRTEIPDHLSLDRAGM